MQTIVTQVARSVPFDNTSNSFTAKETQSAVEEARNSASGKIRIPDNAGFDGTASSGRWLERTANAPSNEAPLVLPQARKLQNLAVTSTSTATGTLTVYKSPRDTPVSIATITITAGIRAYTTAIGYSLVAGDEVGYKMTSGSFSKPCVTAEFESI
jgi:hypothetical protein